MEKGYSDGLLDASLMVRDAFVIPDEITLEQAGEALWSIEDIIDHLMDKALNQKTVVLKHFIWSTSYVVNYLINRRFKCSFGKG